MRKFLLTILSFSLLFISSFLFAGDYIDGKTGGGSVQYSEWANNASNALVANTAGTAGTSVYANVAGMATDPLALHINTGGTIHSNLSIFGNLYVSQTLFVTNVYETNINVVFTQMVVKGDVTVAEGNIVASNDVSVHGILNANDLQSGDTNIIGAIGALATNAVIPETQGNIAGTWAIDFTVGRVQSGVQTGAVTNVTFTVSSTNAESSLVYQLFSNGGSVTWDTNTTTFVGGTAPTLTSNEWNRIFISGFRDRYFVGWAGSAP